MDCDTTSRLFGLGKGVVVKSIKNDPLFHNRAGPVAKEHTIEAGEVAPVSMYVDDTEEGQINLQIPQNC